MLNGRGNDVPLSGLCACLGSGERRLVIRLAAPDVKMISSGEALRQAAIRARASLRASAALWAGAYRLEGLYQMSSIHRSIA